MRQPMNLYHAVGITRPMILRSVGTIQAVFAISACVVGGSIAAAPAAHAADRRVCERAAVKKLLQSRPIYRQAKKNDGGLAAVKCLRIDDDTRYDALFAIFSGGTAGNIAWGAARGGPSGHGALIKLTTSHSQLGVGIRQTEIGPVPAIAYPVFRPGDGNCCASGGFVIQTYDWLDGTLQPSTRTKAKHFPPGFDARPRADG